MGFLYLGPELIAWEGKDGETSSFSSILLMETKKKHYFFSAIITFQM